MLHHFPIDIPINPLINLQLLSKSTNMIYGYLWNLQPFWKNHVQHGMSHGFSHRSVGKSHGFSEAITCEANVPGSSEDGKGYPAAPGGMDLAQICGMAPGISAWELESYGIWVNFITTSLFSLTGIMVSKGNHPQMAARFRLVKYYILPIYIYTCNMQHNTTIIMIMKIMVIQWP